MNNYLAILYSVMVRSRREKAVKGGGGWRARAAAAHDGGTAGHPRLER